MVTNGKSPTALEIDGILFDLNKITKPEYYRILGNIQALDDTDYEKAIELSGTLYQKVILSWPFAQPITVEGYSNLGLMDSARVDEAFKELAEVLNKKKLERLSIRLEDITRQSET